MYKTMTHVNNLLMYCNPIITYILQNDEFNRNTVSIDIYIIY